jgi:DNA gyrase subunit A
MRAVAEIEEGRPAGGTIVVTELPYQTSSVDRTRQDRSWSTPRDRRHRRRQRRVGRAARPLVIELKRDANANVVLNNLYKHTPLQTSFAVNMVALVDGVPRTLNLRDALQSPTSTTRSRSSPAAPSTGSTRPATAPHRRGPASRRSTSSTRSSPPSGPRGPRRGARGAHGRAVRVQRDPGRRTSSTCSCAASPAWVAPTSRTELAELRETHRRARGDPRRRRQAARVIKDELAEIRAKEFATPRRTEITFDPGDIDIEDLIDDEELVVTLTEAGATSRRWRRRVPHPGPRRPRRGGRQAARRGLRHPHHHTTRTPTCCSSPTAAGCTACKAHEIPDEGPHGAGHAIVNLLPLSPTRRSRRSSTPATTRRTATCSSPPARAGEEDPFTEYDSSLRDRLIAINLRDGDELVRVIPTNGDDDIFMVSRKRA